MKGKVKREDAEEMRERIIKAVKQVCEGRCELIAVKKSEISNSLYFTISNGREESFFRISDHATYQNVRNFVVSKSTKITAVERFVIAMIKNLNKKSLYHILNSLSGEVAVAC